MQDGQVQPTSQKSNYAGAAIAGMIVGAAAGATAVLLSDEKNRKKVMDSMNVAKGKAVDLLNTTKDKVHELTSKTDEAVDSSVDSATHALDESERSSSRTSAHRMSH